MKYGNFDDQVKFQNFHISKIENVVEKSKCWSKIEILIKNLNLVKQ